MGESGLKQGLLTIILLSNERKYFTSASEAKTCVCGRDAGRADGQWLCLRPSFSWEKGSREHVLCVASSPGDMITQLNPSHFTDVLAKAVIFTLVPRLVWGGGGAQDAQAGGLQCLE